MKKGSHQSEETKQKMKLSHLGYKHPLKTIEKMRLAHKGIKHTEESIKKMIGRVCTQETREKRRNNNLGKKATEETKKKMSLAKLGKKKSKESIDNFIKKMTGHKVSEITREKLRLANTGKKMSEESKQKNSLAHSGKNHPNFGKHLSDTIRQKISDGHIKRVVNGTHNLYNGNGGVREDLKEYGYIASSLEANYIRYLKFINEPFEYQVPILLSNNRWYICDFYLPNSKQFIELKGYLRENSKIKYDLLKLDYPMMKWRMIMQDENEWKNITKQYSKIIPNWEFRIKKEKVNG